jgi:hypothetical protein
MDGADKMNMTLLAKTNCMVEIFASDSYDTLEADLVEIACSI